ncbi:uncharacterized protein [Dermacentor albipictus]|uniref:uncharacterized protein n=1 Tax=Dermacentor albipictus TaxID=60249 RepID=UPI0038FBF276
MGTHHLFTVLLFTTSLSMWECKLWVVKSSLSAAKSVGRMNRRHHHGRKHSKQGTIENLYSNRSLVWAVNTTAETSTTCRVDVVTAANPSNVNFNRTYYWKDKKTVNPLEGTLVVLSMLSHESWKSEGMLLHGHDATIFWEEELLSVDDTIVCGVF